MGRKEIMGGGQGGLSRSSRLSHLEPGFSHSRATLDSHPASQLEPVQACQMFCYSGLVGEFEIQ